MKFYNTQYPNMTIRGNGLTITFVNGVYETSDATTIQLLKDAGFATDSDEKTPAKNKK